MNLTEEIYINLRITVSLDTTQTLSYLYYEYIRQIGRIIRMATVSMNVLCTTLVPDENKNIDFNLYYMYNISVFIRLMYKVQEACYVQFLDL